MALRRELKLDIDTSRMQEIWREAVDLEPIKEGTKVVAVPPDVRKDFPPPPLPTEEVVNPASLRVVTVPNVISLIRLLLVPVLVWLLVFEHAYAWAFGVMVFIGFSDWADGKIARYWHIESKIGAYLDPAADRVLTVAVPVSMAIIDFIPWWIVVVIVVRDSLVASVFPIFEHRGLRLSVIYLGKLATASLMVAFPLLLLAHLHPALTLWVCPFAWAVLSWALVLHSWTGILYVYRGYLVRKNVPVLTVEEKRKWEEDKKILPTSRD